MTGDIDGLTTTVSVDYKVNLDHYESASCFVSVSGVTPETTDEEMDEILAQSKIVFNKIKARIAEQARKLRDDFGN